MHRRDRIRHGGVSPFTVRNRLRSRIISDIECSLEIVSIKVYLSNGEAYTVYCV